jgi:hypothetical protein
MGAVFGVALVVVQVGNAFGPTAMNSFRIHFGVLNGGWPVTALPWGIVIGDGASAPRGASPARRTG